MNKGDVAQYKKSRGVNPPNPPDYADISDRVIRGAREMRTENSILSNTMDSQKSIGA